MMELPYQEPLPTAPRFSDATLRDSAHMAGVEFAPRYASKIADLLVATGIELVEVGMISGPSSADADLIEAVHETIGPERSMSLVMVRERQQVEKALDEALRLGVRSVMFSIPTSEEHARLKLASPSAKYVTTLAGAAIGMAKERGFHVTFSGEDGARTPPQRLVPYVEAGFANGADRFRLAETVASLTPWQMQRQIANLTAIDGAEIEIHSHNMLGMAVANSLAACRAGARWISATAGGIGERGGNAPLAELLLTLRVAYGDTRFDLSHLTEVTALAIEGAGLGTEFQSGPTTRHAYAYELPGQLTEPWAYESLPPEAVGNVRDMRVRTRITAPLVRWALQETDLDLDVDAFTAWLVEHQHAEGGPLLDRDHLIAHAHQFAKSPVLI